MENGANISGSKLKSNLVLFSIHVLTYCFFEKIKSYYLKLYQWMNEKVIGRAASP